MFRESRILKLDALVYIGEGEDRGVGMKRVEFIGGGSVEIGVTGQQAVLEATHEWMKRRAVLVIVVGHVREGVGVVCRHSL
jgi:hypothetical protein